jgi:hypothetical protein
MASHNWAKKILEAQIDYQFDQKIDGKIILDKPIKSHGLYN